MGKIHVYFFPFLTKNCTVPREPSWREWFESFISDIDLDVDWVNTALNSDKKGQIAFTLEDTFIRGIHTSSGWLPAPPSKNPDMHHAKMLENITESGTDEIILYVFGHCGPGQDKLWSPNGKEGCSADQLFGYLSRIPKNFSGKIKLHGCNTAVPNILSRTQAFAYELFRKMKEAGYDSVQIYGYTSNIANFHTRMSDGSIHRHRVNPQTNAVERNKNNRVLITDAVRIQ